MHICMYVCVCVFIYLFMCICMYAFISVDSMAQELKKASMQVDIIICGNDGIEISRIGSHEISRKG